MVVQFKKNEAQATDMQASGEDRMRIRPKVWLNGSFDKILMSIFIVLLLAPTTAFPFPLTFTPPYFQFIGICVGFCVDTGFSPPIVFPPGTPMAADIFLNS